MCARIIVSQLMRGFNLISEWRSSQVLVIFPVSFLCQPLQVLLPQKILSTTICSALNDSQIISPNIGTITAASTTVTSMSNTTDISSAIITLIWQPFQPALPSHCYDSLFFQHHHHTAYGSLSSKLTTAFLWQPLPSLLLNTSWHCLSLQLLLLLYFPHIYNISAMTISLNIMRGFPCSNEGFISTFWFCFYPWNFIKSKTTCQFWTYFTMVKNSERYAKYTDCNNDHQLCLWAAFGFIWIYCRAIWPLETLSCTLIPHCLPSWFCFMNTSVSKY